MPVETGPGVESQRGELQQQGARLQKGYELKTGDEAHKGDEPGQGDKTRRIDEPLPGGEKPERGKIIILVAPSGAGKTTLARKLMNEFPNIRFSVSATTRPPRINEIHGKDYFFLSPEEFQAAINNHDFLEWEEFYGGMRYGSLISEVEKELNNGYFVLFDIEVKGALNVKAQYGSKALAVFIRPPSDSVLLERLRSRGTESNATLQMRLERARMELGYADRFDHVIINDDLDRCYVELRDIVSSFINI